MSRAIFALILSSTSLGIDDHAHLAAGLDGVRLAHAFEAHRQVFQVLQALDVALERLSRARRARLALIASAAMMIGVYGVVAGTSPWWPTRAFSTASGSLNRCRNSMPICGWPPSVSWSIALPMSCSKPAAAGERAVEAQLVGDHLRRGTRPPCECRSTFCP